MFLLDFNDDLMVNLFPHFSSLSHSTTTELCVIENVSVVYLLRGWMSENKCLKAEIISHCTPVTNPPVNQFSGQIREVPNRRQVISHKIQV